MNQEAIRSHSEVPVHPNSPYFPRARDQAWEQFPDRKTDAKKVEAILRELNEIDAQGIENFQLYKTDEVTFAYSTVNINELVWQNHLEYRETVPLTPEKASGEVTYVIFGGIAGSNTTGPFLPWDITYDRGVTSIPEVTGPLKSVMRPPEERVSPLVKAVTVASPNGLGGEVKKPWLKRLKEEKHHAYKNLYADFIEEVVLQGKEQGDHQIVLQGISMGAFVKHIGEELEKRGISVQVLVDNPVESRNTWERLRAVVGFTIEGIGRGIFDIRFKQTMREEGKFRRDVTEVLKERGIDISETPEQSKLKDAAARQDVMNIVFHGSSSEDGDNRRVYERVGKFDPILCTCKRLWGDTFPTKLQEGILKTPGRTLRASIKATHFIDRFRIGRWNNIIENVNSQYSPEERALREELREVIAREQEDTNITQSVKRKVTKDELYIIRQEKKLFNDTSVFSLIPSNTLFQADIFEFFLYFEPNMIRTFKDFGKVSDEYILENTPHEHAARIITLLRDIARVKIQKFEKS